MSIVQDELAVFYEKTFSGRDLMSKVEDTARTHQDAFGDRAAFWYLLAIGVEIAKPQLIGQVLNPYLAKAEELDKESDAKYYLRYCELLHVELQRRYYAAGVKMSPSIRNKYWVPLLRIERTLDSFAHPSIAGN